MIGRIIGMCILCALEILSILMTSKETHSILKAIVINVSIIAFVFFVGFSVMLAFGYFS